MAQIMRLRGTKQETSEICLQEPNERVGCPKVILGGRLSSMRSDGRFWRGDRLGKSRPKQGRFPDDAWLAP